MTQTQIEPPTRPVSEPAPAGVPESDATPTASTPPATTPPAPPAPPHPSANPALTYNDLGQPVLRVRKDLLAVGAYRPPDRGWTLAVDRARLARLAERFARMKAAGVRVPVVSVDARGAHNWKPENARGYLIDLEASEDRLVGTLELIGEEAVRLPGRSEVSVGIHPDFRDGLGRAFGEVIDQVAICLNPVVPDQRAWRIAASRGGDAGGREELALAGAGEVRRALVEVLDARLERLVERGRITPAVGVRLRAALLFDDAPLLSLAPGIAPGNNPGPTPGAVSALSPASLILEALADNHPVAPGEVTAAQAIALPRPVPGEAADAASPLVDARLRALGGVG